MKRPVTISVAAILVLVMILIAAIWPLVGGDQLFGLRTSGMPGNFPGTPMAQMQGTPMPDQTGQNPGQPQGTHMPDQNGQPAQGAQPQGNPPNGQFREGRGQFGNGARSGGLFGSMRILEYVLYALIIILGLVSFGGLWSWKKWGTWLAIISAAVVITSTLPSFIRLFSAVMLIEAIVKLLIAAAVIILVLLSISKKTEAVA